jgi:hypothetical protein
MRETTAGNLYIDKHTEGGQPISFFQSGGAFFTEAQTRRAAQNAWLQANSVQAAQLGWLWVQGESDSAASEAAYLSALTTMTTDRVTAGLMLPTAARVLVQMRPGTALYGAGVAAAKRTYAAGNGSLTALLEMSGSFDSDNIHLNARGQLQLGYDAFSALTGFTTKVA